MILDLINRYKDQYKAHITSDGADHQDELYRWQLLKTFQDNWNIDAPVFKSMFERSFANTLATDLWEGQSFFPKRVMLNYIDRDPDLMRMMFRELFNEKLDIEGRIERFVYHCDEIRDDIMRSEKDYQNHYHDDYRMISVYLSFRYPLQYAIYESDNFNAFLSNVKATPMPELVDIGRFFKVMRAVYTITSKDEELLEASRQMREGRNDVYQGDGLLLVSGIVMGN